MLCGCDSAAQGTEQSPIKLLSDEKEQKPNNGNKQKKEAKLVYPNHNGYEVASGSGSELQK